MASPVAVTGNTQTILGSTDVASLTVELCNLNNGIPSIPGQTIITNTVQNITCTGGSFSFSVYGNDVIYVGGVTNNTFYMVRFFSSTGNLIATLAYQFTGASSIDLSQLAPLNNTPPMFVGPVPSTAVLTNPTGAQTISTYGLTVPSLTASGLISTSGTIKASIIEATNTLYVGSSQQLQIINNGSTPVFGVSPTLMGIAENGVQWVVALDNAGNFGVLGNLSGQALALGASTPTVSVGQVGLGNTTSLTATGGSSTLPANPLGFLVINISGTAVKIPYYAS